MSDPARTRLAVLGSPIAHSKSPAIQRAAYRVLGLPWEYEAIEMTGAGLAGFVASRDSSWRGLSLTMPLKRDILPLLTTRDAVAERVGAANTVLFRDDGIQGFNTDVFGIVGALRDASISSLSSVHILGAGATAASVIAAVAELGATAVTVAARTPSKALDLVTLGSAVGVRVEVRDWGADLDSAPDLIVSTVPGHAELEVPFAEDIRRHSMLFDVAYDPWPSPLAASWLEVGGIVVPGIDMLFHQAIGQVRVFVAGDSTAPLPREAEVLAAMRSAVWED